MRDDGAELLGVAPREVSREANLLACGLDYMRVMELASRWRRHDVEPRSADMLADPLLDVWARLVHSTQAGAGSRPLDAGQWSRRGRPLFVSE